MIYGTIKRTNRSNKQLIHRKVIYSNPLVVITGPSVLLASEDPLLRTEVGQALDKEGYEVHEMGCTLDVLKYVEHKSRPIPIIEPIEILIIDISHNPWAGMALFKTIRNLDWAIPVILIHESQDHSFLHEMKRLGAYAMLRKPLAWEQLHQEVMNASPHILALASA